MKLKSAILAVSLLAFGAGAAHAGQWSMGLNAGAGMPTGDYGDIAATGWNIGGNVNNMVNNNWGFGADLGYHSWGVNKDLKATFAPGDKLSLSAIQATAHAMYNFPVNGNAKPYFQAGLGLYNFRPKAESGGVSVSDSHSDLGFNFGGGMNFATQGNMTWGFGGAYHVIKTAGTVNANTFTAGLNLNFGMGK